MSTTTAHYQVLGEGTPVVLLHGFCEDLTIWDNFIPPLIAQYKIITIDLPGFGQSATIPNATIEDFADAVATVLQALNIEKAIVIGHSMGGYATLAFAKKYPNKVLGLGLFHSHPFEDDTERKANRQKAIDFIKAHGTLPFVKQMIPKLFAPHFADSHPKLMEIAIQRAASYPQIGVTTALKAMKNRADQVAFLQQVTCPVLFIIGKEDASVPYQNSLKMSYMPAVSQVCILDKVGHSGMFESPEACRKAIEDFIQLSILTIDC